jgi:hypothetical protein
MVDRTNERYTHTCVISSVRCCRSNNGGIRSVALAISRMRYKSDGPRRWIGRFLNAIHLPCSVGGAFINATYMIRFITVSLIILLHRSVLSQDCFVNGTLPGERIVVEAKEWRLVELPLGNFTDKRQALSFDIEDFHTPSHIAVWEIRDDALYLSDLTGTVGGKPFDPTTAFGKQLPVRADWYSGKLTLVKKQIETDYALNAATKFIEAKVYLVSHGHIIYMRNLSRMASGVLPGRFGFTLKREDDHFVAIPIAHKLEEASIGFGVNFDGVKSGDIVHGLIDPNGVSLEFSGESEEVVNAALSGVRGTEVNFIVSSPSNPKKIRVATHERK